MKRRWYLLLSLLTLTLATTLPGCLVIDNTFEGLPPGPWRGVLKLRPAAVSANPEGRPLPEMMNLAFEEVTEGELPFNFELIYTDDGKCYLEIINGAERVRVDDITIGLDRSTAKDTVVISFPVFDSYIRAIFEEDVMEGEWVVTSRENYRIPFVAHYGQNHRFTTLRKPPQADLSGRWEATFGIEGEAPYPAVAEFAQDGNHLSGTFLTETGDYRFLEGTVQDNKLYLSAFDGAHAFLFEGKIQEDGSLIGSFRSGKHFQTLWQARRNSEVQLRDAHSLTLLKEGYDRIVFAFENPAGQLISPDDVKYRGKVLILQLLGTWCPNCHDETRFLVEYLRQRPELDLEIIGLAFERQGDEAKAKRAIQTFADRLEVPYEIVLAGGADKEQAAQALPMLNAVVAYPTLIFIGRDGQVRRIHTGFSGPATSAYPAFTKDFENYVNQLLAE
jgi:thiol-disulfide isomerase/thioredoxin